MPDPRTEIRQRIVRRLKSDDWMERHFGIVAHAGDVADAVLELFEEFETEHVDVLDGQCFSGVNLLDGIPATRIVLRTAPEEEA